MLEGGTGSASPGGPPGNPRAGDPEHVHTRGNASGPFPPLDYPGVGNIVAGGKLLCHQHRRVLAPAPCTKAFNPARGRRGCSSGGSTAPSGPSCSPTGE